jgi:hypothetical protein
LELSALRTLLEELALRLDIDVRYESMGPQWASAGGLCRLKSRRIILIDSRSPLAEQVGVLLDVLEQMDLEAIYVPPAVRRELECRRR